jgi:hypothetical protein
VDASRALDLRGHTVADVTAMTEGDAIAMLVAAGLVMECIAASCSSPQTAEINASKRQKTLMKWVHIGMVESAVLIGIAALFTKRPAPIVWGGALAAGTMYVQYRHALKAGLASHAPGTES